MGWQDGPESIYTAITILYAGNSAIAIIGLRVEGSFAVFANVRCPGNYLEIERYFYGSQGTLSPGSENEDEV